ncbi:MAG: hypothetical protein Q8O92_13985 [Candidatus Latescibacter sp.]|nr:hypothetical protein [Candidatus Latescibacter sp.]
MKRRDLFRLVPFTLPAFCTLSRSSSAQERPFNPERSVHPLALMYTQRVREMLLRVRDTQSDKILEAAYAIARTVEKGNRCWCCWDLGHTNSSDIFPDRNGEPELVTAGYDAKQVRDGDLVLANFPWPAGYLDDLAKKDLFVVGGPCPWGGDIPDAAKYITPDIQRLKIRPYADIWIETNVDFLGAQVKVPGSPAPLGPESGPLNGAIFWMMIADACRVLARDGKPVKVKGDEPKLSEKVPRSSLTEPLMDDYFDTVMMQLEMIAMEMGDIRKMAGMAVDTLLSGGNVYFYSRYPESMANEASGRRGGFAFARGLTDGRVRGTAKDCVIMGTYKPDDEADLKNLDAMKNLGMKVASIGPITRDTKIPAGKIVARGANVHVGRMTDTYGLFALPGFEQKVCPTSGILVTAILWTVSAEIVQQIISRTGGNVPGINFNGALTWANSYNAQAGVMSQSRGY